MRNLNYLNAFRQTKVELQLYGSIGNHSNGVFAFRSPVDDKFLRVIASKDLGWEHVSVSKVARIPGWREMEWVKRKFFEEDETAMQLHVPPEDHLSFHNFCLHLWRPIGVEIPRPPSIMVAPPREGTA